MNPTSWIDINLGKLDANVAAFRAMAPGALLCGAVKADAYGLGVVPIAQRLSPRRAPGKGSKETLGVDMLAVYSPAQAEQLVALGLNCPLLMLMRVDSLTRADPLYRAATTGRLHLTVHDREQLAALEHAARLLGSKVSVHLYVDTGMSRSGLSAEQFIATVKDLPNLKHVTLAGVYTHLASADSDEAFTDEQATKLEKLVEQHRGQLPKELVVHVANTHATLRNKKYHRDMVRVGLGLYGYGAEAMADEGRRAKSEGRQEHGGAPSPSIAPRTSPLALQPSPILPIVRWRSRIIHVQDYPKGTPVGYGSTHTLTRDSVLGIIPVGYADGYPRHLSNAGVVSMPEITVDSKLLHAKVVGRVNMDQIIVDLTDAPASVGTLVELISDDPASPCALHKLAALAGTNEYEMLCRLSARVPRKYVN